MTWCLLVSDAMPARSSDIVATVVVVFAVVVTFAIWRSARGRRITEGKQVRTTAARFVYPTHPVIQAPGGVRLASAPIDLIRQLLGASPRSFDRGLSSYLIVVPPKWLQANPNDEQWLNIRNQDRVRRDGQVVWATIVQANSNLFKRNKAECGASAIYSPDPWFDQHREALGKIAQQCFATKGKDPADAESSAFARMLTNEMTRGMRLKVPDLFTGGRKVYHSSMLMPRKHLPKGVLSGKYFPVWIDVQESGAIVMVPAAYWPASLTAEWDRFPNPPEPAPEEVETRSTAIREAAFGDHLHEYRIVKPGAFEGADLAFYQTMTETFERMSFKFVGDVENVSLSRLSPKTATFTRALVNPGGDIVAGVRERKSLKPGNAGHTVELHTEFTDGTFIITNNTRAEGAATRRSPQVIGLLCGRSTPIEELLTRHSDAVGAKKAHEQGVDTVRIDTIDQYIHFQRRLHGILSRQEQARGFIKPPPVQSTAQGFFESQSTVYSMTPHEYRAASAQEFPSVDIALYDVFRTTFEANDFIYLGDIENVTVTKLRPHQRTFIRVLVTADGSVTALGYSIRLAKQTKYIVELYTELNTGFLLQTTLNKATGREVAQVECVYPESAIDLPALVTIHRKRVKEAIEKGGIVRESHTLDDVIGLAHREQRIKALDRQTNGLLTADDLRRIKGRELTAEDVDLLAEVIRLESEAARSNAQGSEQSGIAE